MGLHSLPDVLGFDYIDFDSVQEMMPHVPLSAKIFSARALTGNRHYVGHHISPRDLKRIVVNLPESQGKEKASVHHLLASQMLSVASSVLMSPLSPAVEH